MNQKIKKRNALIIAFGLVVLSLTHQTAWAGDATLRWFTPVRNEDGSALTDLKGYRVYYGKISSSYTQVVNVGLTSSPAAPAYTLTNLSAGNTYYFAVTAYDTLGNESKFSNEAVKTLVSSVTTTLRPTTTTTRPVTTTTTRPVTTTTIPPGAPQADALTFSNITTAAGVIQAFTIGYSDSDGWQNLSDAAIYIAGGGHDQWLHYNPATNRFTIDGVVGSCLSGQATVLSTTYLNFNCYASTYSGSGNTLTVTFSLTPKPAFAGVQYRLLIYVTDKTGRTNGKLIGNWMVYPSPG